MSRCPAGGWPDPNKGCPREGVVQLRTPAPGRVGMRVDVCREHEASYRRAGWVDVKEASDGER